MCFKNRKPVIHIKPIKMIIFLLCCISFMIVFVLSGCQEINISQDKDKEEVVIPAVFLMNPSTGIADHHELVDEFNKQYQGQYYIDVEWLTETASGYRAKLKQWNALDEMPVIITDAGFDRDFYELLVKNHRLINLKSYMYDSKAWLNAVQPDILENCEEKNGDIYLSPLGNPVNIYGGFIYNKSILESAGHERFPDNWKEFWKCLVDLQRKGRVPLALHGSGTYWVSMLIATACISGTQEGRAFLKETYPENYSNDSMTDLLNICNKLFDYTYADALEIDYDQAARRFFDGKAAIIANGRWMFDEMTDDQKDQYGFASFPDNTLLASPKLTAWAVTSGYDEDITEGAIKFLEYRTLRDKENAEHFLDSESRFYLEKTYKKAVANVKYIMPDYQLNWKQKVLNEFFTEYMPPLMKDEIDTEIFINILNKQITE